MRCEKNKIHHGTPFIVPRKGASGLDMSRHSCGDLRAPAELPHLLPRSFPGDYLWPHRFSEGGSIVLGPAEYDQASGDLRRILRRFSPLSPGGPPAPGAALGAPLHTLHSCRHILLCWAAERSFPSNELCELGHWASQDGAMHGYAQGICRCVFVPTSLRRLPAAGGPPLM